MTRSTSEMLWGTSGAASANNEDRLSGLGELGTGTSFSRAQRFSAGAGVMCSERTMAACSA
jgi:hypothetical protein